MRKRRGKRKRKDAVLDVKGSIGESDNVCSISGISASNCKETSTSSDQSIKATSREDNKGGLSRLIDGNSMAIFNSLYRMKWLLSLGIVAIVRRGLDIKK